jgi:hypothetical protein
MIFFQIRGTHPCHKSNLGSHKQGHRPHRRQDHHMDLRESEGGWKEREGRWA